MSPAVSSSDGDPRVAAAVQAVRARAPFAAEVGVVLGSGLGAFADGLDDLVRIPFADIPHFRPPRVPGHAGSLCFGRVGSATVACLQGRVHLYEGHAVADVVLGARVLAALGCGTVLLTNAAGGIRAGLVPGSLMLVVDHLNLTGHNPLSGYERPFVDLTRAYDARVCDSARAAASRDVGVRLHDGVYAGMLGPSYETPAEIRMLRTLGADAVGMSTVMETIALRHAGVRVGAVSCITNLAAGLSPGLLDHAEVEATAKSARDDFESLLAGWVVRLVAAPSDSEPGLGRRSNHALENELVEALIESARAVRDKAYAPYSGFQVGAAVMSESGHIYVGCNVENASYGATLCAERAAVAHMIASGDKRLVTVAIFVDADEPAMPCGICRQVIAEFGTEVEIVSATPRTTKHSTIEQLLPDAFVLKRER